MRFGDSVVARRPERLEDDLMRERFVQSRVGGTRAR